MLKFGGNDCDMANVASENGFEVCIDELIFNWIEKLFDSWGVCELACQAAGFLSDTELLKCGFGFRFFDCLGVGAERAT